MYSFSDETQALLKAFDATNGPLTPPGSDISISPGPQSPHRSETSDQETEQGSPLPLQQQQQQVPSIEPESMQVETIRSLTRGVCHGCKD